MQPTEIKLLQKSRQLILTYASGEVFTLACSYLRENSPSADKSPGAIDVNIIGMEPAGNYAIKIIFSDGHDSGIYTWEKLLELGRALNAA